MEHTSTLTLENVGLPSEKHQRILFHQFTVRLQVGWQKLVRRVRWKRKSERLVLRHSDHAGTSAPSPEGAERGTKWSRERDTRPWRHSTSGG